MHFLIPLDDSPLKAASVGDVSLSRPLGIDYEPAGYEPEWSSSRALMDGSCGGRALRWSCLREMELAAEEKDARRR